MLLFPSRTGRINARMPSSGATPEGAFSGSATHGVADVPVVERTPLPPSLSESTDLAKVLRRDTPRAELERAFRPQRFEPTTMAFTGLYCLTRSLSI